MLATFLTVVGPAAYALLSNLLSPEKPASKTYEELIAVMKNHLKPKPLIIAEQFCFHRRNQADFESESDYMTVLRKLAEKCDFRDYLSEALRDRLVCGLRSEATQRRLLAEEDLTLKKAYEMAISMEAASRRASELHVSSRAALDYPAGGTAHYVGRKPHKAVRKPNTACYRCGKVNHTPDQCFCKDKRCRSCGKQGHIARVCKSKPAGRRVDRVEKEESPPASDPASESEDETSSLPLLNIQVVSSRPLAYKKGIMVNLHVNGKPLEMELDTGASVSLVSQKTWKKVLKSAQLRPSAVQLRTYTGENLEVLGELVAHVSYGAQECQAPLVVVKGNGSSLFG